MSQRLLPVSCRPLACGNVSFPLVAARRIAQPLFPRHPGPCAPQAQHETQDPATKPRVSASICAANALAASALFAPPSLYAAGRGEGAGLRPRASRWVLDRAMPLRGTRSRMTGEERLQEYGEHCPRGAAATATPETVFFPANLL